ncbi:hypothetical protein DL93DRAFT_1212271 [Clavulina sp. PMI_390]|nr:hypothetical protein DL93DRAFT_1212271 [Clavulina sp. PMI_390]
MVQISSFPVELIQSIFILATITCPNASAPTYYIDAADHRRHLTTSLTISYVCSEWRSIALSTGQLWSRVIVLLSKSTTREMKILEWHLTRAGGCPLDVTVDSCGWYPRHSPTPPILWGLIRPRFPQCRSLSLPWVTQDLHNIIFPLRGSFPYLEILDVWFRDAHPSDLAASIFDDPTSTPSLESLKLTNPHVRMLHNITLPMLKHFYFGYPRRTDIHEIYDLLRSCTSLTNLSFTSSRLGEDMPYPLSPVTLPALSSLSILDCDLDRVIRPSSLRYLECWGYRGAIDHNNLSSIRDLTLSFSASATSFAQNWLPPAWMRGVEVLTMIGTPTGIPGCAALCALEPFHPDLGVSRKVSYFPCLKSLVIDVQVFLFGPTQARDTVRDLNSILAARVDLRARVSGRLIPEGEIELSDLLDRFGSRVSFLPVVAEE